MAKSWNRMETWLGLFVLGIAMVILAIAGLWMYMSATATPLHPDAQSVASVQRSEPPRQWADAVERGRQIARAGLTEQNLPGLSVAVGRDGEILWAEGFGWSNLESRTPVTPETRFRIGNASIALASAAAGRLVEQGRLTIDAPIQTYVPEFPVKQWPVTLRQVMGHTAGIVTDGGDEGPLFSERCDRPVEALRAFADRPLLFEPGTQYRFSNYGGILLSAAIEAAADEPFLTFMQKQVFEPLRMDTTMADSATESIADRATPYFPRFAADPRYGADLMRDLDYSCYSGASVFLSTASDLVRFAIGINGGKLLQPATVQLLQTSQRLSSGQGTGYGLGWDLETATLQGSPAPLIGHDGESLGGQLASFMAFPGNGLVVSVISNTSYADTYSLALKIAEVFASQR